MNDWRFLPSLIRLNKLHKELCSTLLDAKESEDLVTYRMVEKFLPEVVTSFDNLATDFECLADFISSVDDKRRMQRVKRIIREFFRRARGMPARVECTHCKGKGYTM